MLLKDLHNTWQIYWEWKFQGSSPVQMMLNLKILTNYQSRQ